MNSATNCQTRKRTRKQKVRYTRPNPARFSEKLTLDIHAYPGTSELQQIPSYTRREQRAHSGVPAIQAKYLGVRRGRQSKCRYVLVGCNYWATECDTSCVIF